MVTIIITYYLRMNVSDWWHGKTFLIGSKSCHRMTSGQWLLTSSKKSGVSNQYLAYSSHVYFTFQNLLSIISFIYIFHWSVPNSPPVELTYLVDLPLAATVMLLPLNPWSSQPVKVQPGATEMDSMSFLYTTNLWKKL